MFINGVEVPDPPTLASIDKQIKQILSIVKPPTPATTFETPMAGRRAENVTDALLNAYLGLDADGYPHRWPGDHPGSTQDWAQHLKDNKLEWPPLDFGPEAGSPTYSDWKDWRLALYLLSQSDGLKTPREIQTLGMYAGQYGEKIVQYGWKTTTVEEWFAKIRSTNGQGGASGGNV